MARFPTFGLQETILKICALYQEAHEDQLDVHDVYRMICQYKQDGGTYNFRTGATYDPEDPNEHGWFPEGIALNRHRGYMTIEDKEFVVTAAGRFYATMFELPDSLKPLQPALLYVME